MVEKILEEANYEGKNIDNYKLDSGLAVKWNCPKIPSAAASL